ncbi:MAG TPA: nucleotidyltransferase family protein [Spirochaetota bacterium]|nr:nucleotidyltransferase family protein [Spirochaetota bacterium]HNT12125.1 nucleotidyltransferase family protein [Spirochaetota bacterium]
MKATLTKDEILGRLNGYYNDHREKYKITTMGIFGSFARGDQRDDSDIDVVFETTVPNLFTTSSMKIELEELFQRPVDIVRYRDSLRPSIKRRIEKEAVYVR